MNIATVCALVLLGGLGARAHELRIDPIGKDVLARHFSGYGWSLAEARAGKGFAWIQKMEADLTFDWPQVEDVELTVQAAPFFLTAREQVVGVFANGAFIGQWTFPESPDEQTNSLRIPAAHVRAGPNTVTFRVAYQGKPKPPDNRKLGLLVDWVWLRSLP